ncbi:4-carboxymuconolactone decarboxylase [Silvimonas terrae]|uniref:4-carboxymuconolactone decarboxylase n=1 Tax=Silvimonas terrae TaxID=300266 RepID=A0A840REB0_9NEIS|nr:carboxymuconolactone decarboxylase family protein [Silvimonas terrae]MBB5190693.1 4-carboxymuconolactone decarboxylase [Silvimonas terrae]
MKRHTWFLVLSGAVWAQVETVPLYAQEKVSPMSEASPTTTSPQPSRAQQLMGDIDPKLAELTDKVLFGDIWERKQLSRRDRSLVTVAALIALNRPDQLRSHMALALQNGVTKDELVETITQLAFYSGWPNAVSAVSIAREVFRMADATAGPPSTAEHEGKMITVIHAASQPSVQGSADYFTGSVQVDSRFQAEAPARSAGGIVTFEPGARTAWHTHPLGQTLIVTSGTGLVQQWGGPVQVIKPGDIVWIPPGVKHWHGATATSSMTHIAIAEAQDGKSVDWMEQVSNAQYQATQPE